MKFAALLSAFLLAIGISISGFFVGNGITNFKALDRDVTVKGLAEKEVKSDQAIWQLRFSYGSDDMNDLYQGIQTAQQKISAFLQQKGFAPNEIEILPVSVNDNKSNNYGSNTEVKRFKGEGEVILTTAKVDQVKNALQQTNTLLQEGVVLNQGNIKYLFTQLNSIKPGMLDEATNNAKTAAESFARNSNSHLGPIRSASQGLFTITDAIENDLSGTSVMKKVRIVTTVQYYLN
jgi:uncharacterized protein